MRKKRWRWIGKQEDERRKEGRRGGGEERTIEVEEETWVGGTNQ